MKRSVLSSNRGDELMVAVRREADVLAALDVEEWRNFEQIRDRTTEKKGRALVAALARLCAQGKVQKRGRIKGEAWRRMPGKPLRCSECGRPFDPEASE